MDNRQNDGGASYLLYRIFCKHWYSNGLRSKIICSVLIFIVLYGLFLITGPFTMTGMIYKWVLNIFLSLETTEVYSYTHQKSDSFKWILFVILLIVFGVIIHVVLIALMQATPPTLLDL